MSYEYSYSILLWREENPGHWGWKEIGNLTDKDVAVEKAKWWNEQGINSKVVEVRKKTVVEFS